MDLLGPFIFYIVKIIEKTIDITSCLIRLWTSALEASGIDDPFSIVKFISYTLILFMFINTRG